MTNRVFFILSFVVVVGCGPKTVEVTIPQNHPANPDAPQTVFEIPSDALTEEMAPTEEGASSDNAAHHGAATLSEEGEGALTEMLDAYFVIGDQLASDTIADVNAKAHAMLEAFHTLEHEAPAELWSSHEDYTEAIHDYGHELGDLSDIKAARIAYGSLSDSLNHLIAAVGVPASYEKPVYSFVCGMAKDIPQNGIWLQIGDNVRNPYFGSAMLKCHSEKVQLPVVSSNMKEKGEHELHHHDMPEGHHRKPERTSEHEHDHDGHTDEAPEDKGEKHEHKH